MISTIINKILSYITKCIFKTYTIITPEVILTRSSRTKVKIFQFSKTFTKDRNQTVSRRFKPSSRTTLIDEQSNP